MVIRDISRFTEWRTMIMLARDAIGNNAAMLAADRTPRRIKPVIILKKRSDLDIAMFFQNCLRTRKLEHIE
jgi:hypothetical protein